MNKEIPAPLTFAPKISGAMGVRAPGEPPFMWIRDMANAINPILKNATICTQVEFDGKKEELETLDTIIQLLKRMYITARETDNIGGLLIYQELMDYLRTGIEIEQLRKGKVYTVFCQMFVISLFAYMFGSKQMLIATPKSLDESSYDFGMVLSMLSSLPDDKRREFIKLFRDCGTLKNSFDLTALNRTAVKYLEDIKKNQQERYAKG